MGFYEEISKYYDYIFPAGAAQLKFISESAGSPPKRLLDVACGSGAYSEALAKAGYSMVSIDIDGRMVELARDKASAEGLDMRVMECDMREIVGTVPGTFDCVFCIGNSLVHLGNTVEIRTALGQMRDKLTGGGSLLLQIINFDRIIKYGISNLPEITVDEIGLKFIRNYKQDELSGRIHFDTVLTVEKDDIHERYENSVELLPITRDGLIQALKDSGFGSIDLYGDFNRSPWTGESFLLVAQCTV